MGFRFLLVALLFLLCGWETGDVLTRYDGKQKVKVLEVLGGGSAGVVLKVQDVSNQDFSKKNSPGRIFALKVFAGDPQFVNLELEGYESLLRQAPELFESPEFLKFEPPKFFTGLNPSRSGMQNYKVIAMPIADPSLENQKEKFLLQSDLPRSEQEARVRKIHSIAVKGLGTLNRLLRARLGHYDIKPDNLLYNEKTGALTFADFGSARFFGHNAVINTAVYAAPEQYGSGRRWGPTCDLYSFGSSLYFLIFGRPPLEDYLHQIEGWDDGKILEKAGDRVEEMAHSPLKHANLHNFVEQRLVQKGKALDLGSTAKADFLKLSQLILTSLERKPRERTGLGLSVFPGGADLISQIESLDKVAPPPSVWEFCSAVLQRLNVF